MTYFEQNSSPQEFWDRHPRLPFIVLLLVPFLVHFPAWLTRGSLDPLWYVSGATHGKQLLPATPFLDPNAGYQSEALGHLVAWDWIHGIVPWWNPYNGIGMPLTGEIQPGGFFLPFTLLYLLPNGVQWLVICMEIAAGIGTYLLLRELQVSPLAALTGGTLFSLNGSFAWSPAIACGDCVLACMPWLIWGIELARKPGKRARALLVVALSIAWSILAGFPEMAYINGLLALAWGLYRLAGETERWKMARATLGGWALGVLIATPQLISFLDYLKQSDALNIHDRSGQSLPWAAMPILVLPYVYGMLGMTFHSVQLSQIWANIGGYAGVVLLLVAAVGLAAKSGERGVKRVLFIWTLIAWARSYGIRPVMALMSHVPLLKETIFYRYAAPSWEFSLILLAAFGIDEFRTHLPRKRFAFGYIMLLLAISVSLAWPGRAFWGRPGSFRMILFGLLGASLALALTELAALCVIWSMPRGERQRSALALLLVCDAALMFVAPMACAIRGGTVDHAAITYLQDHVGLQRTYSLGPIRPNFSAYFQIPSINHNMQPFPSAWRSYVNDKLFPGYTEVDYGETYWSDVMPPGTAEAALSEYIQNYREVGVRYITTYPGHFPYPTIPVPSETADTMGETAPGHLGAIALALAKAQTTESDSSQAGIKQLGARIVLKLVHRLRHKLTSPSAVTNRDLLLTPSTKVAFQLDAPAPPLNLPISGVILYPTDSSKAVDGALVITACVDSDCRTGEKAVSHPIHDFPIEVTFDEPLTVKAGDPMRITIARPNGSGALALHTADTAGAMAQVHPQLRLEYATALAGAHKVYEGPSMDIWELPGGRSYYEVVSGGPCTLANGQRESFNAECSSPAKVLRRELSMQGWSATINHASTEVGSQGVFQTISLPAGRNSIRFRFTPPNIVIGWVACVAGFAGLLIVFTVSYSRRHGAPTS